MRRLPAEALWSTGASTCFGAPFGDGAFTLRDGSRMTSRRSSRKVWPRKGSSAFGEPMREDSPAARITAASMAASARRRLGGCLGNALVRYARRRAAPDGDQLRGNANGDFLRRERANFEAHGSVHTFELVRRDSLAFKGLVNGKHLAAAPDHADVVRASAHGPFEHAQVIAVPARYDHQVRGGVRV